jgi:hypothetical protein
MAVLLARTKRDGQVGVGIVGRGGLAGMPVVLGTMRSPSVASSRYRGRRCRSVPKTFVAPSMKVHCFAGT